MHTDKGDVESADEKPQGKEHVAAMARRFPKRFAQGLRGLALVRHVRRLGQRKRQRNQRQ